MNLRLTFFALLLAGLPARNTFAAPNPAAATADASGSFASTQARIKVLFQGRDAPPVLPEDLINPFSPPAQRLAARGESGAGVDVPVTLSSRALLERLASAIQVRGIVQAAGRPSVVINQQRFSPGDRVTVQYGNVPIVVEIKRITGDTYTLAYKDAELTLRLSR